MKRISAVILALTLGMTCLARHKVAVGTDIGNIMKKGMADIYVGYEINERWTVTWKTGIDIKRSRPEYDIEYSEHQAEFSTPDENPQIPYDSTICLQYWMDNAYDGFFLGAGCRSTAHVKADCTLSLGYAVPIWSGLRMTLAYETDMLASFKEGKAAGTGFTIGICWIIKIK